MLVIFSFFTSFLHLNIIMFISLYKCAILQWLHNCPEKDPARRRSALLLSSPISLGLLSPAVHLLSYPLILMYLCNFLILIIINFFYGGVLADFPVFWNFFLLISINDCFEFTPASCVFSSGSTISSFQAKTKPIIIKNHSNLFFSFLYKK